MSRKKSGNLNHPTLLKQLQELSQNELTQLIWEISDTPTLRDIWYQPELSQSYWLLIVTGLNHTEEMTISDSLLRWHSYIARDSASVRCVSSSEHQAYNLCISVFGKVSLPALVFSDSPEMENLLKIDAQLLDVVSAKKGGLEKFLVEVHTMIQQGETLESIEKKLMSEKFWSKMKMGYSEVKSLLSFSIKTDL